MICPVSVTTSVVHEPSNLYYKMLHNVVSQMEAKFTKGMWVLFGSFFMFSNFYQLDLHNKTCIAVANLR